MKRRALITGIGGQDGYFLAKLLLEKEYEVFGLSSSPLVNLFPTDSKVYANLSVYSGDLLDQKLIVRILSEVKPDEIYHFAAQSNVGKSYFHVPETYRVNTVGSLQLFESAHQIVPEARIYFSGSSEMFGDAPFSPQDESTPFRPKSPYGMSKVAAYYSAKYHKESTGQFIATGITYNHESERRPAEFVTQKICRGLYGIAQGSKQPLVLGNLQTIRDWGFAGDYVEAMWKLLQHAKPIDAVIATGIGSTVQEFVDLAARALNLELSWSGAGATQKATLNGEVAVYVAQEFYRPSEKVPLIGNPAYILKETGWKPTYALSQLVNRMIAAIQEEQS